MEWNISVRNNERVPEYLLKIKATKEKDQTILKSVGLGAGAVFWTSVN